jgi:hypothetical protein
MLKRINKLLEYKWFPVSFRIITLVVFLLLVLIGFSSPTNDSFFVNQLSKTNLTTSFIWRLWWPMIVLTAILLGRVWCMVCPVEMVTTFFARFGLKLRRPRWILSGWIITLFYMTVLSLGITILHIDLNPKYTSYYLLFIMGISILTGLIFEKNTFCRYICPVGYLLGIFSKLAIWGWRVKKESVCAGCKDKSCISSKYTYQLNFKSCGVDLIPAEISSNSHCLLCSGCLKTCKTYNTKNKPLRPNPAFVKIGFANDLLQLQSIRLAEWIFIFFLTGSLIFEMTHFKVISDISAALIQKKVSVFLNLKEGVVKDIANVLYLYLLLPSLVWLIPLLMIRLSRLKVSFNTYRKTISLIFVPIIAAFFSGLAIMEIVTKLPYYKYIVRDVRGVETIKAMLFKQIEMPQFPYWTEWLYLFILLISLVLGIIISYKVTRELAIKLNAQKNITILSIMPLIFIITIFAGAMAYQLL